MSAPISFHPNPNIDPASNLPTAEPVSNQHAQSSSKSAEVSKAQSCYRANFRKSHTPESITIPIAVRLFGERTSVRVPDDNAGQILIDKLNRDFEATGIQFSEHSTAQINQSCADQMSLESLESDYQTSQNYVNGAMNLYVCESEFLNPSQDNGSFVAGTSLTASGFLIVNNMDATSTSVLPHETGHSLGLFHTFEDLGFPFLGCKHSGDLVCDTPRDNSSKVDPDTQIESPNKSNFMDYSNSVFFDPRSQFTPEQAEIMRCVAAQLFD